jgi:hypothetical protein
MEAAQDQDPLVARAHLRIAEFRARGIAYIVLLPHGMLRFYRRGQLRAAQRECRGAEVLEMETISSDEITRWALAARPSKGQN